MFKKNGRTYVSEWEYEQEINNKPCKNKNTAVKIIIIISAAAIIVPAVIEFINYLNNFHQ